MWDCLFCYIRWGWYDDLDDDKVLLRDYKILLCIFLNERLKEVSFFYYIM